eukprot:9821510-Lingulodinium_polyedra.AAC.1
MAASATASSPSAQRPPRHPGRAATAHGPHCPGARPPSPCKKTKPTAAPARHRHTEPQPQAS